MEKLTHVIHKNNSLLCVGLDIDQDKIPKFLFTDSKTPFFNFNKNIIDSTKDFVCAYKLNMAFYEVLGKNGCELLEKTINYIPKEIIVILDGKRNDIGNTARKYAQSLFEKLKADAVTVNPYLGKDGIIPFLKYKDKTYSKIIANPPFTKNQDIDHLKEMFKVLESGGKLVCITSESWVNGNQKKQTNE